MEPKKLTTIAVAMIRSNRVWSVAFSPIHLPITNASENHRNATTTDANGTPTKNIPAIAASNIIKLPGIV